MSQLRIFGGTINLPDGLITDAKISSNANIDVDKMQHLYKPSTSFDKSIAETPVTRTKYVFVAASDGTIRGFNALLKDTGTSTDIDFDLLVNGVSVLSSVVNITHSDSDNVPKAGTISDPSLSADDIVSIEMTVTSSTGALGPFAWVDIQENAG